jgi:predicted O-linked N-acetylglucosamine transferase (SPINDLY family)
MLRNLLKRLMPSGGEPAQRARSPAPPYEAADRLIAEGNRAENDGRLPEACVLYRKAVDAAPGYARAHLNLGIGLEAIGDADGAFKCYDSALACDPADAYANYNLAKLLYARGELARAERLLGTALERKPEFPEARVVLSNVYDLQGNLAAAVTALEVALKQRPDVAGAWHNYGVVLRKLDRLADAIVAYQKALTLAPDYVDAHIGLGKAFEAQGRLEDGVTCYRKAASLAPRVAEIHFELGNRLLDQGNAPEAVACFRRALELQPDFPAVCSNLGNALKALGRLEEAIACYKQALQLKPDFLDAHYNLGIAYRDQARHNEAVACFQRVIDLNPDFAQAYYCLGQVFHDEDRHDESLNFFQKSVALNPEFALARWAYAMSQLPAVYGAEADQERARTAFSAELEKLNRWFDATRTPEGFNVVGAHQPFCLAYQETNNRELLQRYGRLCARLMADWIDRQGFPPSAKNGSTGVIRVGIVSQYFRNHSVWNAIVKGWFQQLNRARFSLNVFYLGVEQDRETHFAKSRAAYFESGQKGLRQWVDAIIGQQPDVLIYPEIGMDPMTARLASLRLAPVQAVTWGHPETSGLPTIDYYLSAEDLEPADAQANYTEQLVALPHLGCCYQPSPVAVVGADLGSLGIHTDSPLFICPGMPFKYAPQYDSVITEIARGLGRCRFIFFKSPLNSTWDKLRRRLEAAFAQSRLDFDDFVTFIPWQDRPGFYGLLKRSEVLLDTIGFSGFNTALQALECGLPIVTREGRFMRGRLASGILKRMGLPELVARSEEDYVALAVKLARDTEYRKHICERIVASRHVLFEDIAPIRALEAFLVEATSRS